MRVLLSVAALAAFLSRISNAELVNFVNATAACLHLSKTLSANSHVFAPGEAQYFDDIEHYFASSILPSTCTVEPGNAQDVGIVLRTLGDRRVPFGVKGGGHTGNVGFSASTGVLLSMARFNAVDYDASSQTIQVGSGLVWDDVYSALAPFGVNVVGGRVSGVGVAGLTLGGGYSWLTNQRGLVVDNVAGFELVTPDGRVIEVDGTNQPDLFFALKGGYNNFGVVTKFKFKTFPQGQVWGGLNVVTGDQMDAVMSAFEKYLSTVNDPKAALIVSCTTELGQSVFPVEMFYDGDTPPPGIFDDFLAIPAIISDVSTRSFLSLVQSAPVSLAPGTRGNYNTPRVAKLTPPILRAVANETSFWTKKLANKTTSVSFAVEAFLPNIFSHAPEGSSAFPSTRKQTYAPIVINFQWLLPQFDDDVTKAIVQSQQQLTRVAASDGQDVATAPAYGNYAVPQGYSAEDIFGQQLGRLRAIKSRVDPHNIMGLAGGWKV